METHQWSLGGRLVDGRDVERRSSQIQANSWVCPQPQVTTSVLLQYWCGHWQKFWLNHCRLFSAVSLHHLDFRLSRATIEILPGEIHEWVSETGQVSTFLSPYVFVDGHLGIPQKQLFRDYIDALSVFKMAQENKVTAKESTQISDLIASTSVILVANPAHLAALNARKQLVQQSLLNPSQELAFSTVLVSLRNSSKQSILWHHRRWLFKILYPLASSGPQTEPNENFYLPHDVLEKEFAIIAKACEVYPRNYYAWTHWQFCIRNIRSSGIKIMDLDWKVLIQEFRRLRRWVETHVSDHSSIHHLCNLVRQFPRLESLESLPSGDETYLDNSPPISSLDHAISLACSYPDHESLWMYVRAAYGLQDVIGHQRTAQEIVDSILPLKQGSVRARQFLAWIGLQVKFFFFLLSTQINTLSRMAQKLLMPRPHGSRSLDGKSLRLPMWLGWKNAFGLWGQTRSWNVLYSTGLLPGIEHAVLDLV